MKRKIIIVFILFFTSKLYSQINIDSIEKSISKLPITEKVDYFIKLSKSYITSNRDLTLKLIEKATYLSDQSNDNLLKAKAYYYLGELNLKSENFENSFKAFTASLEFCEIQNNKKGKMIVLKSLSSLFMQANNINDAIKCQYEILGIAKSNQDTLSIIGALIDITNAYIDLNLPEKALEVTNLAEQYANKCNDQFTFQTIYLNRGACEYLIGNYAKSLVSYNKATDYLSKIKLDTNSFSYLNIISGFVQLYTNIAESYIKLKDVNNAKKNINIAIDFAKKTKSNYYNSIANEAYAKVYALAKDYSNSFKYLAIAEKEALEINNLKVLKEVYNSYTNIYHQSGNHEKALDYSLKKEEIEDAIKYNENLINLAYSKVNFDLDRLNRENSRLIGEQNKIESEKEEAERISVFSIFLLILILISGFIYFYKNRRYNQLNKKLQAILDTLPDLIFHLDKNGKFLPFYQEKHKNKYFKKPEEFINKSIFEIFDESLAIIFNNAIYQTLNLGDFQFEYELQFGELRTFNANATKLNNDQVIISVRDITEAKIIANELATSEVKFRLISENASDGLIHINEKFKTDYVSPSYLNLLGYSVEEQLKVNMETLYDFMHPDDKEIIYEKIYNAITEQTPELIYEYRSKHKDDHYVWREDNAKFIYDENSTFNGAYIVCRDITERKESEKAVKESEEKYRLLVENSYDIIYTLSPDGRFVFLSDAWTRILGYPKNMHIGLTIESVIHPDDLQMCIKWLSIVIETGEGKSGIEYRVKHQDGQWLWHSSNVVPVYDELGNIYEVQGIAKDITKQKADETQIRKLSVAVEQNPTTIVITDTAGNIEYANSKFSELTGYTFEEAKGKNPSILKSGKTDPNIFADLWDTLKEGNVWKGEFINKKKNGEEFIEQATIAPIFNENGIIINYLAIKEDVSLLHKTIQTLNEQNEQLNILINNLPVLVYFKDNNFNYRRVNELYAKSLNIDQSEIIGKSDELLNIHNFEFYKNIDQEIIKSQEPLMNLESIHQSVNGDKIWVSTSKVPYRNEDGDVVGIIGIVQDITYYKETEIMLKELNQSKDKFFSIMAHDIRNPLGSFMQLTSLLYDDYAEFTEEERLECIETIKNSANNLYSLLLNLLEWSRSQQGSINFNPEIYDLKSTIEDIFDLFSLTAEQKKITINNNLNKFLAVKYDPNLIKTVVRNLLSNAIKFTPEGGSIEIGLIEQPDSFCIFIKDTGLGIPQETIDKLFRIDTNVISSLGTNDETGTGLGLILCKEFIDKHKGKIWVESELGKGSTFYFTLPKN